MLCEYCKKEIIGRKRKFCNDKCRIKSKVQSLKGVYNYDKDDNTELKERCIKLLTEGFTRSEICKIVNKSYAQVYKLLIDIESKVINKAEKTLKSNSKNKFIYSKVNERDIIKDLKAGLDVEQLSEKHNIEPENIKYTIAVYFKKLRDYQTKQIVKNY